MGKTWDRLQGYNADTGFKGMTLPRQRYRNVKCPDCGKWVFDHPPNNCTCGGVARMQNLSMELWHFQWLVEALRVLVPGGVIKAFSGSRTYHRLAAAMYAAGYEDLHIAAWAYGSGFPKSLNIAKSIDSHLKVKSEVTGTYNARGFSETSPTEDGRNQWAAGEVVDKVGLVTEPVSPEAKRFKGYGTALKPAWEPFVVGRKPL